MNMKNNLKWLLGTMIVMILTACGGGGSSSDDGGNTPDTILPSENADLMSSYENSKTSIYINYDELPIEGAMLRDAIGYLDAEGDGDIDVFMGTGIGLLQGEVDSVLSINDGTESFTSSTSEFSDNMPPATHARKTLVSDFNGDGLKDMLILDHGFDAEPFPGNQPKLIMQDSLGKFSWKKLPEVGFHHGGAAADIDNDGDIDIFVADHEHISGNYPYFYINDGNGNFTKNSNIFDNSMQVVYVAELIDVDKDGFVDLLVGAHEKEGADTSIYWGGSSGKYISTNRTILPQMLKMDALSDFDAEDIDGDGDRDIIINRAKNDGGELCCLGRTTQLLRNNGNRSFTDITSANIDNPGGDTDQWFPWLRVQDFDGDGDVDIRPDNAAFGFEYTNDGTGKFTKTLIDQ